MKPFERSERVSGQIKRVLSDLIIKEISDPRMDAVVITGVKISKDLKWAKIYYVCAGSKEKKDDASAGFKSARGYIKRTLAQKLGLRYMPELTFYYDESFDYGSRIENLLKKIKTENGSNHSAH
jgi:ribosome-binding factor A